MINSEGGIIAEEYRVEYVADRVRTASGDFFTAVPSGGDAYIMKHIIHDWDDARATTILKNIAKAMGAKRGKVILLESVIAAGAAPDLGKFIDIEMLAWPGGKERSADEFRALFAGARVSAYPHATDAGRHVENWVKAFEAKVDAIVNRPACPS